MVTAVVLSGGGSLGAVQAGMLLALYDAHVTADLYVGSSVGALNAAYIAGHPDAAGAHQLARIWTMLRREDVFPTGAARVLRAMIGRACCLDDSQPLRQLVRRNLSYELGADTIYVLPTGYACALENPPRSALGMGIHAVTLAVQQRLIADVAVLQRDIDLRVAPPLCPLAVSPIDFTHTAQLIERARVATTAWLKQPPATDQATDLALHAHHRLPAAAGSKGAR